MKFLKKQIKHAVSDAHENIEDVDIVTAVGRAEVNENRAILGGETNNNVYALFAKTDSNKTKSIIYNYAAHPVNASKENCSISAGFPGYANTLLSRIEGCTPMFLQGSCGDVDILNKGVFKKAKEYGHVIAGEILSAPTSMIANPDMRLGKIKVELPAIVPSKKFIEDTIAKQEIIHPSFGRLLDGWKQATLKGIEDDAYSDVLERDVNVLYIGPNTCMIFHPFELFTSLDTTIRAKTPPASGITELFLNGYSNDSLGYLVPDIDEANLTDPTLKRAINYSRVIVPMVTKSPHLERDAGKVFVDQVAKHLEESY
jgi:hypothetical protein